MKTAVEWIVEQLNKSTSLTSFVPECDEDYKQEILGIIEQAKEMEKEQIIEAFSEGAFGEGAFGQDNISGKQYYNETFKDE